MSEAWVLLVDGIESLRRRIWFEWKNTCFSTDWSNRKFKMDSKRRSISSVLLIPWLTWLTSNFSHVSCQTLQLLRHFESLIAIFHLFLHPLLLPDVCYYTLFGCNVSFNLVWKNMLFKQSSLKERAGTCRHTWWGGKKVWLREKTIWWMISGRMRRWKKSDDGSHCSHCIT